MGRKSEGLGPAFSCRLRADQDAALRAEALRLEKPLVTVLRSWIDSLDGCIKGTEAPEAPTDG